METVKSKNFLTLVVNILELQKTNESRNKERLTF